MEVFRPQPAPADIDFVPVPALDAVDGRWMRVLALYGAARVAKHPQTEALPPAWHGH